MATFKFTNVSADRADVKMGYDAPVNPTLSYADDKAAHSLRAANLDMAIAGGDIKLPVYDLGAHSFAVVHPGETFTVDTEKTAEIAFYTDLACKLAKSDCVKVEAPDVAPEHSI